MKPRSFHPYSRGSKPSKYRPTGWHRAREAAGNFFADQLHQTFNSGEQLEYHHGPRSSDGFAHEPFRHHSEVSQQDFSRSQAGQRHPVDRGYDAQYQEQEGHIPKNISTGRRPGNGLLPDPCLQPYYEPRPSHSPPYNSQRTDTSRSYENSFPHPVRFDHTEFYQPHGPHLYHPLHSHPEPFPQGTLSENNSRILPPSVRPYFDGNQPPQSSFSQPFNPAPAQAPESSYPSYLSVDHGYHAPALHNSPHHPTPGNYHPESISSPPITYRHCDRRPRQYLKRKKKPYIAPSLRHEVVRSGTLYKPKDPRPAPPPVPPKPVRPPAVLLRLPVPPLESSQVPMPRLFDHMNMINESIDEHNAQNNIQNDQLETLSNQDETSMDIDYACTATVRIPCIEEPLSSQAKESVPQDPMTEEPRGARLPTKRKNGLERTATQNQLRPKIHESPPNKSSHSRLRSKRVDSESKNRNEERTRTFDFPSRMKDVILTDSRNTGKKVSSSSSKLVELDNSLLSLLKPLPAVDVSKRPYRMSSTTDTSRQKGKGVSDRKNHGSEMIAARGSRNSQYSSSQVRKKEQLPKTDPAVAAKDQSLDNGKGASKTNVQLALIRDEGPHKRVSEIIESSAKELSDVVLDSGTLNRELSPKQRPGLAELPHCRKDAARTCKEKVSDEPKVNPYVLEVYQKDEKRLRDERVRTSSVETSSSLVEKKRLDRHDHPDIVKPACLRDDKTMSQPGESKHKPTVKKIFFEEFVRNQKTTPEPPLRHSREVKKIVRGDKHGSAISKISTKNVKRSSDADIKHPAGTLSGKDALKRRAHRIRKRFEQMERKEISGCSDVKTALGKDLSDLTEGQCKPTVVINEKQLPVTAKRLTSIAKTVNQQRKTASGECVIAVYAQANDCFLFVS